LNFERSGDDWDDREVDRILRKHVFAATLPRLVRSSRRRLTRWTSAPFDTLKRALSKHLKPNTYMSAPGGDSDLAEADGEYAADAEERPRSAGPAGRPTAAVPGAGPGTRSPDRATEPTSLQWSGEGAARRRVSFGAGDVQALPFRDESFRLVVALGVVPWVSHPRTALLEMGRVLEPEGFLVVSATNRWSLIRLLDPHPLRNPLLDLIRRLAEALLPAVVTARRERITIHSLEGLDRLLRAAALESLRSRSDGFGPLTLFQRPILPETMAVSVHRRLQTLADHDIPGLRSLGSQYLVLCKRQRPRSSS
jgi:SAM-dependent methyltransferase